MFVCVRCFFLLLFFVRVRVIRLCCVDRVILLCMCVFGLSCYCVLLCVVLCCVVRVSPYAVVFVWCVRFVRLRVLLNGPLNVWV